MVWFIHTIGLKKDECRHSQHFVVMGFTIIIMISFVCIAVIVYITATDVSVAIVAVSVLLIILPIMFFYCSYLLVQILRVVA